jgi:hypothetical protein
MAERPTPFDVIFARPGLAERYFPAIAEALGPASAPGPDRERFLMLGLVGELMGELAPESGEVTAQIGLLTFHAFHHWQQGGSGRGIDEPTLLGLIRLEGLGDWQLEPPAPAGYIQLPRHVLWVAGSAGQPAEPVDGFFWVTGDPQANALELLLVLGLHEGRPGVTVIELASGPLPTQGHWGDLQGRAGGEDFSNVLAGGERLYGLSTAGEVLKLASRLFWYLQAHG